MMFRFRATLGVLALSQLSSFATAQVVNPATSQAPPSNAPKTEDRLRSWELPPTTVTGESWSSFRESDLIGDYGQPRWTSRRLFPTTRVYVLREGQFDFEYWTRIKVPRDSGKSTVEHQYEFEIGLPHRFQLDVYHVTEKAGSEGETNISEDKFELRYALADWGVIPWNPTLYAEWVSTSGGPDVFEGKLLLGDEVAPGWRVGSNLVWEHEVSGDLTNQYELTVGVNRVMVDEKFSLGAEMKASIEDVHSDRGDFEKSLEIGPSLQWRPVPPLHIDFAPLIGIGGESRAADIYLVIGWEF
jgi:hypothetical protein